MQVHELIHQEFLRAQARSPQYSLRAFFAKAGNISVGALGDLSGPSESSPENVPKEFSVKFRSQTLKKERFIKALAGTGATKKLKKSEINAYVPIAETHYHVLSDWYCFAILALSEIEGYQGRPAWISKRLSIKLPQAKSALQSLEKLGLVMRTPRGEYLGTGKSYSMGDGATAVSIQKAHRQGLELAVRSLEEDAIETRDFSAINMAIDPEKLPEARKLIRDFRRRLSAIMESGRRRGSLSTEYTNFSDQ